jgi:hypothetical protein
MDGVFSRERPIAGRDITWMRFHSALVAFLALSVPTASLTVAAERNSRLANLSTRTSMSDDASLVVAGFVIGGNESKDLLIRAIGPSLAQAGIKNSLKHPKLEVFDGANKKVAANDQWTPELRATFAQLGASALPDGSLDAALRVSLPPGSYTTQVTGIGGSDGIVLVEVYEINAASRLVNISTRAHVGSEEGLLISGFVVSGNGGRRVLLRASGPALKDLGVSDALTDPVMTLLDHKGLVIGRSDNWDEGGLAPEILAMTAGAGALPFRAGSKDSSMVVDLEPGVYSIHVSGAGSSNGEALLEVFDLGGMANGPAYADGQLRWDGNAQHARLGPTFADLNPGAPDDRPFHAKRESKSASGYYVRINPFELGDAPGPDTDYWSDSGQVAYVPDDPNDPGLDRIQTFAYYNQVFATSPRLDWATGKPHPDPQTKEGSYTRINGEPVRQPIAMVRNYAMQQNEALVLYRDGLLAVAGTQTSRAGTERPYPGFKFPANKKPVALAVTTSNEFAVVTVWDLERHQGQLAVVALEGKYLPFHTWPYMGMPNQGSFSDFKLLGYVDLPMSSPDAVAAASNGLWLGPSSTDNKVLSQIDLTNNGTRKLVYDGAWQFVVAKNGYVIVSSSADNVVAIVDLTALFSYMRDSYLKADDVLDETLASRGAAPAEFPQTFLVRPSIAPKVVWKANIENPTAVLAGLKVDRWSGDRFKAYVASRDGRVHIIDTSPLMARNSWETKGKLEVMGTVQVGRNPVSLTFTRHAESGLPLIPNDSSGNPRAPDPLNNMFYVACRGERDVAAVVTWGGKGEVYRRIRDARMGDPVAVGVASRGNVITVADYQGRKLLGFRIGTLNDARNNRTYPPLEDGQKYEFTGELFLPGNPFLVNSTNVN